MGASLCRQPTPHGAAFLRLQAVSSCPHPAACAASLLQLQLDGDTLVDCLLGHVEAQLRSVPGWLWGCRHAAALPAAADV